MKTTHSRMVLWGLIARNGHMLHNMGLGTSRHKDDQLPCCRSRMRSADDRARFAGIGNKGVRFGKTAEA